MSISVQAILNNTVTITTICSHPVSLKCYRITVKAIRLFTAMLRMAIRFMAHGNRKGSWLKAPGSHATTMMLTRLPAAVSPDKEPAYWSINTI